MNKVSAKRPFFFLFVNLQLLQVLMFFEYRALRVQPNLQFGCIEHQHLQCNDPKFYGINRIENPYPHGRRIAISPER